VRVGLEHWWDYPDRRSDTLKPEIHKIGSVLE